MARPLGCITHKQEDNAPNVYFYPCVNKIIHYLKKKKMMFGSGKWVYGCFEISFPCPFYSLLKPALIINMTRRFLTYSTVQQSGETWRKEQL